MKIKDLLKKYTPPKYRMLLGTINHNVQVLFKTPAKIKNAEKLVIVVVSPHKVGSTWVYNILREMTYFIDIFPPYRKFKELRRVRIPIDSLIPYFDQLPKNKGYLFKSHSLPPKNSPKYLKLITVLRDPRDVFVSMTNYVGNIPKELGGWGIEYSKLSKTEQLSQLIKNSDFIYDLFYAWHNYDNCLKLNYEDLKNDIEECTLKIINYCNLAIEQEQMEKAIMLNDFSYITKRKTGTEDKNSFYRKGIVGDWKNHFNNELLNELYTSENNRWKDLIIQLGYEI